MNEASSDIKAINHDRHKSVSPPLVNMDASEIQQYMYTEEMYDIERYHSAINCTTTSMTEYAPGMSANIHRQQQQ